MGRRFGLVLVALFWTTAPAAGQDWARRMFETTEHDFGTVARDAKAEHLFVFNNIFLEDVHAVSASPSCGCTTVSIVNPQLKTYQRGAILAKFNTDRFQGSREATITVRFDKPYPATVRLHVQGTIRSDVVVEPPGASFGEVEQGTSSSRTVTITRGGQSGWKVLDVQSSNPHLAGKVVDTRSDGYRVRTTLEVRLDDRAPVGYLRNHLILATNDPRWPSVPIEVDGRVVPSVTVSPETLFLGVIRAGETMTKQAVVRAKQPFRVTGVTTDGERVRLEAVEPQEAKPLHVVPITFVAGDTPGKVTQIIHIETDIQGAAPELKILAVVEK